MVGVPVIAVGKIMDPRQAEKIVEEGRADLVALGRQPNRELAAALQGQGVPYHELGDCVEPRSIAEAIDDAAYVCRFLV